MMTVVPGHGGAAWDDQIVPTLRKRLESESIYLSNRLSSSQFIDQTTTGSSSPGVSHTTGFIEAGPSSAGPSTTQASSSRSRSKSGLTPPSSSHQKRQPSIDHSSSAFSHDSTLPPSRIPTRPRSKSQLGPRPSLSQSISNPTRTHPHPPLPSQIPISSHRRGSSPTKAYGRSESSTTVETMQNPLIGDSRNSLELGNVTVVEGFIKNELPPFKIFPTDEAMRIAEKGHNIPDDGYHPRESYEPESGDKRRRSITMRTGLKPSKRNSTAGSPTINGSVPSHAHVNVGLGLPSTRKNFTAKQSRAASSRSAGVGSSSQAPRSASLNMLASASLPTSQSSRLGVAAHFVPPETYTPPKGANWDEVVLPTIAKKLGLGEERHGAEEGEEGDLAVEWDKDGTPIKWVKRRNTRLDTSQASGRSGLSADDSHVNIHTPTPTSSAFSPTFETSPNNPLRPPSARHKRSGESIELTPVPIRTTQGHDNDLGPPSPAPFSSLDPLPPGWQPPNMSRHTSDSSSPSRRPSVLRKPVTQQNSNMSLRSMNAAKLRERENKKGNAQLGQYPPSSQLPQGSTEPFGNPRPAPLPHHTPGATHMISENAYRDKYGRPQDSEGDTRDTRAQTSTGGRKKKEEEVGKGCGCVVM